MACRERNVVERLFNRLTLIRRVATRHKKRTANHLTTVTVATALPWLSDGG